MSVEQFRLQDIRLGLVIEEVQRVPVGVVLGVLGE
jgi:hypothetical protein